MVIAHTQPVAYGRKSEIFEVDKDKILKLYEKGFAGKWVLKQHQQINPARWPDALLLAAGIHLARKDGDFSGHRKYFDSRLKTL